MIDIIGKYDDLILKELKACEITIFLSEVETINNILCNFSFIKNIFFNKLCIDKKEALSELKNNKYVYSLKNINSELSEFQDIKVQLVKKLSNVLNGIASVIYKFFDLNKTEIISICWCLYNEKNTAYNDGWYMNGFFGVFYDLHRKMQRLSTIFKNRNELFNNKNTVKIETLKDTLIDALNYSVFLIIALKQPEFYLFYIKEEDE